LISKEQLPKIVARERRFLVTVVGGTVQGVLFFTEGYEVQKDVEAVLREKYGLPSFREVERVQNRMGAAFDSIGAIWNFKNFSVHLSGTTSSLDTGAVSVQTDAAMEYHAEVSKAKRSEGPKL
jgi:hypothetical protein